jgi:hypothetical protein
LVITFQPETQPPMRFLDDEDNTNIANSAHSKSRGTNSPAMKSAKKKKPFTNSLSNQSWVNLEDEWGLHDSFEELPQEAGIYRPVKVFNRSNPALPHFLDWHSGLVFTNCDPAWRIIYARGTNAVVVERKFGQGSVVVAGDSYFVSNEAMVRDRHADLLAWLVGASDRVVFDEAHLGIFDSSGVAVLMRQYRLHGLAAGLLLLAGLFIWKNSTSLVPPQAEEQREEFVAGKDSASGFVNLLRRNVPRGQVFGVIFAEWQKSAAPAGKISTRRLQQADAIFQEENSRPAAARNPIVCYQKISEILGNRRKTPGEGARPADGNQKQSL